MFVFIGPPPAKGTCVALKPPCCCVSTMTRWLRVPLPTEPMLTESGFAFEALTTSLNSFQGFEVAVAIA